MSCHTERNNLATARRWMESGELYRAQKMTQELMKRQPDSPETQLLMAEILDRKLERQKESMKDRDFQQLEDDDKDAEIRTWLERSRTLLDMGELDKAAEAAEYVFFYDANNIHASELLDAIRKQAIRSGKHDAKILKKVSDQEIRNRIKQYFEETKRRMAAGQWHAARYTVSKILLLDPTHPDALLLLNKIETQRQPHVEAA